MVPQKNENEMVNSVSMLIARADVGTNPDNFREEHIVMIYLEWTFFVAVKIKCCIKLHFL